MLNIAVYNQRKFFYGTCDSVNKENDPKDIDNVDQDLLTIDHPFFLRITQNIRFHLSLPEFRHHQETNLLVKLYGNTLSKILLRLENSSES